MRRPLFIVCLCLVAIAALWLGHKKSSHDREKLIFASPGEEITVTGRVCGKDTDSFVIDSIHLIQLSDVAVSRQMIPSRTKLICENKDDFPSVRIGSTVRVNGILGEFSKATNDGEFDEKSYYEMQNIYGKLTDVVLCGESPKYSVLRECLHDLREYFKGRIKQIFPEREASLMIAMLLGDKEELDRELKDLYQRNGIIHILSISGLHITLIGMSIYKLFRRLGLKIWVAAVGGAVLLCLYGLMTGMSLSACRAIGMYLIRMLAEIVGRSYDMLTSLGLLAVFLVCNNPGNLENAGFLLSFGSILGIGILYPALLSEASLLPGERARKEKYEPVAWKRMLRDSWKTVGSGLCQALCSGASITLFTLPIQLWFYYEIPVYSILLNVLVLPFVSAIMVTGLVSVLVPGTGIIGSVGYVILKGYEFLCECFEKLPFHTWNPGKPEVWQVVVYYGLLLMVVLWRKKSDCSLRACWVIRYIAVFLAVGVFAFRPPAGDRVTFLDVGQGDCILLETVEGEVYLFDCGSSSRKRIGEYVLLPFLKYHGIGRIDAVFVSHFDEDHCNGIRELLTWGETEGITIGELVVPEVAEQCLEDGLDGLLAGRVLVPVSYMSTGESYPSEGANILCLHPPQGYDGEDNASSMCFYMELPDRDFSLLLTGDVEGEGEECLLQELIRHNIRDVDVLKVAHHGSRNATGEALLEQVTPRMAVISCGRNNMYGHPHKETMERLEDVGGVIMTTSESGAIRVEIDGEMRVYGFCEE